MKKYKFITILNDTQSEAFVRMAKKVLTHLASHGLTFQDVWERPEDFRDAGAGVNGFYYADTEEFFKSCPLLILEVLEEFEDDCGRIKKPSTNLANWYSWFALETTIQAVMDVKEGIYEKV